MDLKSCLINLHSIPQDDSENKCVFLSNKKSTRLKHHFASVSRVVARTLEFLDFCFSRLSLRCCHSWAVRNSSNLTWFLFYSNLNDPGSDQTELNPTLKALKRTSQKPDLIPINHQPYVSTDGLIQPDRTWEDLQRRMKEYPQMQEQKARFIKPKKTWGFNSCQRCFISPQKRDSMHFHSQIKIHSVNLECRENVWFSLFLLFQFWAEI